jgi:probable F420-dependent oxidoreductase
VAIGCETVKFSLAAWLAERDVWTDLARHAEAIGFDELLVPDHPGATAAPWLSLAAAAMVTDRIGLGACVLNTGVREPLQVAVDAATLAILAPGRTVVGLGAGHTPAEWAASGRQYPSPGGRVDRLREVASIVKRLLAGETVSSHGSTVTLEDASLGGEWLVPDPALRLRIGGNGLRLLRFAAAHADIVSVTGLGATRSDGHSHDVLWGGADLDRRFDLIRETAATAGSSPEIEALVQHAEVTEDREVAANALASALPGVTAEAVLTAPFVLIGTKPEIAGQLQENRVRWGITRYVVRQPAIEVAAAMMTRTTE